MQSKGFYYTSASLPRTRKEASIKVKGICSAYKFVGKFLSVECNGDALLLQSTQPDAFSQGQTPLLGISTASSQVPLTFLLAHLASYQLLARLAFPFQSQ